MSDLRIKEGNMESSGHHFGGIFSRLSRGYMSRLSDVEHPEADTPATGALSDELRYSQPIL